MKVRVEQMSFLESQSRDGGTGSQSTLKTISKTTKQGSNTGSTYRVVVNNIYLNGIVDFFAPDQKNSYWEFIRSDGKHIYASHNVLVEEM